jgi:hypothetical protein
MDSQFDWRDYLPLAKAETNKFYRKQERGKFRYEDLLSEAVEALATSPGANYARVAIKGALLDYVRDDLKIVHDVEMSEDEFIRTRGYPPSQRAAVRRVFFSGGVRHTLYTPGAYRTNHELLAGDGKVSSKHGKVSVAIERTTYNDSWSQVSSGRIRAKIEDDQQEFDPRSARTPQPRGDVNQADYVGRGKEKRFSASFLNAGAVRKSEPGARFCNGKVEVTNFNQKPTAPIRRIAVVPALDAGISGRRTSAVIVDMRKFGLEPVPADKLGHWREELLAIELLRQRESEGREPIPASPLWQREAGCFRIDWSVHDRPNGWGDNWLRTYLDRWETVQENNFTWLRLRGRIRADVIDRDSLKQGAPSRSALGSASPLVVLRQAELPSFVPKDDRRTQRPAGQ